MAGTSSNRLKDKKEEILYLWSTRCLKEVESAGRSGNLALRNSLPLYLDHMSEALDTNSKMDFRSVFNRAKEGVRLGKLHGADRADNSSYSLTEVIFEYHILREVIFQVLEVNGCLAETQRDIILDSIEQAVNDAAVEFSDAHAEIQQKFVNTLTHDLKNPIAAAKMNAELMIRQGNLPERSTHFAKRIVGSMNRLESMIHDLLDASLVRAGQPLNLPFSDCDLNDLVRGVLDEMTIVNGDRFIFNSEGPIQAKWAAEGLRRAIENLVGNAVKYSTPQTAITVTLSQSKTEVCLEVHNLGNPIPETEIAHLFRAFHRSESASSGPKRGWGLGLTLVQGVVDAHKGTVQVKSSPGDGTRFILKFPFLVE